MAWVRQASIIKCELDDWKSGLPACKAITELLVLLPSKPIGVPTLSQGLDSRCDDALTGECLDADIGTLLAQEVLNMQRGVKHATRAASSQLSALAFALTVGS